MNPRWIVILIFGGWLIVTVSAQTRSAGTPRPRSTPLTIEGVVRVENGTAVQGTPIVQLYKRQELVAETVAGADGRFRFHEVLPGRYRLTARLEGYQPVDDFVEAADRGTGFQRVEIRMRPIGESKPVPDSPTVTLAELKIPEKAWKEYTRGEEDLRAGKYVKAAEHYRKAIERHPPFLKAWQGLGIACRCADDAAGAERAFRECLRLDSHNLLARLHLAEVCAATARAEEARGILEETVLLHPREGEPHVDLGRLDYLAGRLDEAEAHWRRAVALQHTEADVHLLLAKLYRQRKQYQRMAAELEAYLEKAPDSEQAPKVRAALEQLRRN
jgi:tetratricopeptide (TPR) repeat protein